MKKILSITLALLVIMFSGCNQNNGASQSGENQGNNTLTQPEQTSQATTEAVGYPDINLQENLNSTAQTISQADVLISESGTYEFSGDYTSITVNVNKDIDEGVVYLVLNNANIDNDIGTPIYIIEAQDVVIVLAEGTVNTISQGAIVTTDEEFPSGALHSKADTAITGNGSLVVNTLYQDGINSRDDLIIEDASITVNAVEHGIEAKDLLAISNANIDITCGKDGLKSSNDEDIEKGNIIIKSGNFNITADSDGISAEQNLQIDAGTFAINTGGGFVEVLNEITRGEGSGDIVSATDLLEESMCSLKGANITINGGEFILSSYEDTVHANGILTINGGNFDIISGDDALHADTHLIINDAQVLVQNGYEGIEGETVTINGGDINITVLDDAINANSDNGYVLITNGRIFLKCQGDGIDSNGDLTIEGGEIVIDVDAIYSGGDGELDVTGMYSISGGSITDENGNEISPIYSAQNGGGLNNQPGANRPGGR